MAGAGRIHFTCSLHQRGPQSRKLKGASHERVLIFIMQDSIRSQGASAIMELFIFNMSTIRHARATI